MFFEADNLSNNTLQQRSSCYCARVIHFVMLIENNRKNKYEQLVWDRKNLSKRTKLRLEAGQFRTIRIPMLFVTPGNNSLLIGHWVCDSRKQYAVDWLLCFP